METVNDIVSKPFTNVFNSKEFEALYIAAREKERRIYSDEEVGRLPLIDPTHIHYQEWKVRQRSMARLFSYFQKKNHPLSILEVGCGNGWLTGKLAGIPQLRITGIDVNSIELDQARRVFKKQPNLIFETGDLRNIHFPEKFDAIIFSASAQYFASLENIVFESRKHMKERGELHIMDTHFYTDENLEAAKKSTTLYYQSLGFKEMSRFYFHHSLQGLRSLGFKYLFRPESLKNRIFHKNDPFPWVYYKIG